jgi:hypothetical protein
MGIGMGNTAGEEFSGLRLEERDLDLLVWGTELPGGASLVPRSELVSIPEDRANCDGSGEEIWFKV